MPQGNAALLALLAKQGQVSPIPAPTYRMNDPFATLAGFGNSWSAQAARDRNLAQGEVVTQHVLNQLASDRQVADRDFKLDVLSKLGGDLTKLAGVKELLPTSGAAQAGGSADISTAMLEQALARLTEGGQAAEAGLKGGIELRDMVKNLLGQDLETITPMSTNNAQIGANTTQHVVEQVMAPSGKVVGNKSRVTTKSPTAEGASPPITKSAKPGRTVQMTLPDGRKVEIRVLQ